MVPSASERAVFGLEVQRRRRARAQAHGRRARSPPGAWSRASRGGGMRGRATRTPMSSKKSGVASICAARDPARRCRSRRRAARSAGTPRSACSSVSRSCAAIDAGRAGPRRARRAHRRRSRTARSGRRSEASCSRSCAHAARASLFATASAIAANTTSTSKATRPSGEAMIGAHRREAGGRADDERGRHRDGEQLGANRPTAHASSNEWACALCLEVIGRCRGRLSYDSAGIICDLSPPTRC